MSETQKELDLFDKEAEQKLPAIYNNKAKDLKLYQSLQNFTGLINREPLPLEIKVNEFANNSLYIPISIQQTKLDILFAGLWETRNFKWERMANEIVGSIELRVFHPILKEWITKIGTAAVQIRLKSGSKAYELDNKITNALVMDFPHLEASTLNNACQKLGKWFGRDVNRKHKGDYNPLMPTLNNDLLNKVRDYLQENFTTSQEVLLKVDDIINKFIDEGEDAMDIPLIQEEIRKFRKQLIDKETKK